MCLLIAASGCYLCMLGCKLLHSCITLAAFVNSFSVVVKNNNGKNCEHRGGALAMTMQEFPSCKGVHAQGRLPFSGCCGS